MTQQTLREAAEQALLPCPFCGCNKNIAMANEKHDHSGGYFIGCPECDASTGLRYAMGEDPRPLLIEQWNRRAALAAPDRVAEPPEDAELEALRLAYVLEMNDVLRADIFAAAAELRRLASVEFAFKEWLGKTAWVQKTIQPKEIGKHRADVLRERIEALEAANARWAKFAGFIGMYHPQIAGEAYAALKEQS
jgi:Lar family restriction alleviation protein